MAGKLIVLVAVLCAALAATAGAATVPSGPDASKMTLQTKDFPGSHAKGQWLTSATSVEPSYERDITFAKPFGKSRYIDVASISFLEGDPTMADQVYRILGHRFSSKAYRLNFIHEFLPISGLSLAKTTMIKPRALGVHDSSMEIGFLVRVGRVSLTLSISILRLDRVVVTNVAAGRGSKIYVQDAQSFANLTAADAGAALIPIMVTPPVISGTPQAGATLTATNGGWEDLPTSFTYQWQRCDVNGASCADISGATASTYVVSATDVGSTLHVVVTGKNRFGSVPATSAQTSPVVAAG